MEINLDNVVRELKNRNEKALDYLYENYLGLAYKIALKNLEDIGSREDIEECVSDIFVGVWNNIDKYDGKVSVFKTWFSAVCKYKAIDYRRKLKSKAVNVELDENEVIEPLSTEDKLLLQEDINALNGILKSMKEVDRQIFIRRYILNEKVDDISRSIGISRGAVDNRISRGRRAIKNKWLEITGR